MCLVLDIWTGEYIVPNVQSWKLEEFRTCGYQRYTETRKSCVKDGKPC